MQVRIGSILVVSMLATAGQLLAQDSLTFASNALVLTQPKTVSVSDMAQWRLSGYVGYQANLQPGYKQLYLTQGLHASLAADYFFGRNLGLGVLLGYQNLAVGASYRNDPVIPRALFPNFLPLTSLHSFMLAVGPALSFPISDRLSFNLELRGGVFYNDAPVLGAYIQGEGQDESLRGVMVSSVTPNEQRAWLGAIAFAGVQYQLTPRFGLGVAANGSLSSFGYSQITQNSYFTQNQATINTLGVQAAVSYRFSPIRRQAKVVQPSVVPMPSCYAPILDAAQPSLYEIGMSNRPLFRWRSGSPVYTEGEQYVFRLYTLPGNKLIYEKTTKDTQLPWPAQLIQPDSSSYFFYSVHTSRTDELERTCRSEPVVGTKGFYKRTAAEQKLANAPRQAVIEYSRKLYELRSVALASVTSQTATSRSRPAPAARRTGSFRPAAGRPAAVPDSVRLGIRIVPTLVYEGVTQQAEFAWPDSLAKPAETTLYQYVVGRANGSGGTVPTQTQYLIVEPDGCMTFINEATRNRYLQYRAETPALSPAPADK